MTVRVNDEHVTYRMRDEAIADLETTIDGLAIESDDRLKELDQVHAAVKTAVDDLRALEDVPSGHLFESIGEIVGQLRAVLV